MVTKTTACCGCPQKNLRSAFQLQVTVVEVIFSKCFFSHLGAQKYPVLLGCQSENMPPKNVDATEDVEF